MDGRSFYSNVKYYEQLSLLEEYLKKRIAKNPNTVVLTILMKHANIKQFQQSILSTNKRLH